MPAPKALVLGATGHCGKALTNRLLADSYYSQIAVVVRKELTDAQERELLSDDFINNNKKSSSSSSSSSPSSTATPPSSPPNDHSQERRQKLKQIIVPKFEDIEPALAPSIAEYEAIFCCLGSSIRVQGMANFKQIDKATPLAVAKLALSKPNNHLQRFSIITCVGSTASSSNPYLRTKGEVEDELKALRIPQFSTFRPAGIVGRQEPLFETVLKQITAFLEYSRLVNGNYGNIDAKDLGVAMELHDAELRGKGSAAEPQARLVTVKEMRRLVGI